jgi:deazaflavin-dependent oxidoreductase (nitroreductase family)
MMADAREALAYREEAFCYLTTIGRRSGQAHEIEIWFAFPTDGASGTGGNDVVLYMMAGGRDGADWVRNLRHDPAATIRIAGRRWPATARFVTPDTAEDTLARELLCAKYQGWRPGQPLSEWERTALPVAFML